MHDLTYLNTAKQSELLTDKTIELVRETWRTAEPWRLGALRLCSTPEVYEAKPLASITLQAALFFHKQIAERSGHANNKDEEEVDALSVAGPNPFQGALGVFLTLPPVAVVPPAQPGIYTFHDDVDTWDPQRYNPRPGSPTETSIYEGVGSAEPVHTRCTGWVKRSRKRREKMTKAGDAVGKTERVSDRKKGEVVRVVAWSSVEEWLEGVVETDTPSWAV